MTLVFGGASITNHWGKYEKVVWVTVRTKHSEGTCEAPDPPPPPGEDPSAETKNTCARQDTPDDCAKQAAIGCAWKVRAKHYYQFQKDVAFLTRILDQNINTRKLSWTRILIVQNITFPEYWFWRSTILVFYLLTLNKIILFRVTILVFV